MVVSADESKINKYELPWPNEEIHFQITNQYQIYLPQSEIYAHKLFLQSSNHFIRLIGYSGHPRSCSQHFGIKYLGKDLLFSL